MKFRTFFILSFLVSFLVACRFSLSEDITPPPDYISPTPFTDIGVLYPEDTPSPLRGKEVYDTSCAPCHGDEGMGNGPLASSMTVAVPAIALNEIASQFSPAEWYRIVTIGNIERGMPSFSTHSVQSRWDSLAYIYSMGTTPDSLLRGRRLYENKCSECHGMKGNKNPEFDFTNQKTISGISNSSIYRSIVSGNEAMKPLAGELSERDIWALTGYVRSFSFDMSRTEATPTAPSESLPTAPAVPTITLEGTATISPSITLVVEGEGVTDAPLTTVDISGMVVNNSGTVLEQDLRATVVLYNTTSGDVFDSQTKNVSADGRYSFSDLYADSQTAYWVSVDYQGVSYYSELVVFNGETFHYDLPIMVYDSTKSWQLLKFELVHIALYLSEGALQINEIYVINNSNLSTIVVETDGSTLPFITLPAGISELTTLSPDSRSAPFLPAVDGIALPPKTEEQYVILASFSVPFTRDFEFQQYFPMSVGSINLFVPENLQVKNTQMVDNGTQDFNGTIFHLYNITSLSEELLTFTITEALSESGRLTFDRRSWLLIGSGILGVVFIGLGIFLFLRDRASLRLTEVNEEKQDNKDGQEESSVNDLLDAIISLDEQLKDGNLPPNTHHKRREDLTKKLKGLLRSQK